MEWNINKKVIDQFGPMLRGTAFIAFHGTENPNKELSLKISPNLTFVNDASLSYLMPFDKEHELSIPLNFNAV